MTARLRWRILPRGPAGERVVPQNVARKLNRLVQFPALNGFGVDEGDVCIGNLSRRVIYPVPQIAHRGVGEFASRPTTLAPVQFDFVAAKMYPMHRLVAAVD